MAANWILLNVFVQSFTVTLDWVLSSPQLGHGSESSLPAVLSLALNFLGLWTRLRHAGRRGLFMWLPMCQWGSLSLRLSLMLVISAGMQASTQMVCSVFFGWHWHSPQFSLSQRHPLEKKYATLSFPSSTYLKSLFGLDTPSILVQQLPGHFQSISVLFSMEPVVLLFMLSAVETWGNTRPFTHHWHKRLQGSLPFRNP